MGKALYRKYRSKSLDEIIGQKHITDTLTNAIKSGRISHAYLLTGPRGVGKTSVARILAHQINDIPYTDDSAHLDIIEIDAASNRRIDEIRDLRDKVYIAPTSSKYKVYIIDEVHMLTKEAFNALLKTLEEPPEHVVFILATTDAHKVPETIVSRTQRFTFKPVDKQAVIDHLATIAKAEDISVTPEALALIAEHGQGSFRDSISLLDQARGINATLDEQAVAHMLGIPQITLVQELLQNVTSKNTAKAMQSLQDLYAQGYQPSSIAAAVSTLLRERVLQQETVDPQLLQLMHDLLTVPAAHQPERYLELVLLSASATISEQSQINTKEVVIEQVTIQAPKVSAKENKISDPLPEAPAIEKPKLKKETEAVSMPAKKTTKAMHDFDESSWAQILTALKAQYNTLYGVIRMAKPTFANDELTLKFAFAFHQKRVNETKNLHILSEIVKEVLGKNVKITCIVEKDVEPLKVELPKPEPVPAKTSDIASISNIFGGAELLES